MKLQFKQQGFQLDAVKAVVGCFDGQALRSNRFTLERSRDLLRRARQVATGAVELGYAEIEEDIGYRNSPLQLVESQLLKNIQAVQQGNDLYQSA